MARGNSIIPFTIDRSIKSRSKKVSRSFSIMEKEDLIQDGYVLVLRILKKKPDATPQYLMTALKRYYSHVKKKAYEYTVARAELTDEIVDTLAAPHDHPDRNAAKEQTLSRMKEKADEGASTSYALMVLASEHGLNRTEIGELLGNDMHEALRKAEG